LLSPELKKALKNLKPDEKDKLLFRLLPKNPDLVSRLEFELLESGETMEQRRDELAGQIRELMDQEPYSPGYLMMDMRGLSGEITRHVKTTKDKYGDVSLNLLLLLETLEKHRDFIRKNLRKAGTFLEYVLKRAVTVAEKAQKLHPDLHVEFEDDLNRLLFLLHHEVAPGLAEEFKIPKRFES
jgi:hypothetical protein